ncbi:hypothetical protein RsTz2092_09430 [Deferribacterales bacterium RsTz2092]|nr:hypothetical protein AGMMS49941_07130 [Deferribacterales bacterium]
MHILKIIVITAFTLVLSSGLCSCAGYGNYSEVSVIDHYIAKQDGKYSRIHYGVVGGKLYLGYQNITTQTMASLQVKVAINTANDNNTLSSPVSKRATVPVDVNGEQLFALTRSVKALPMRSLVRFEIEMPANNNGVIEITSFFTLADNAGIPSGIGVKPQGFADDRLGASSGNVQTDYTLIKLF